MLTPNHRVAILLHEGLNGIHGKTGLAYLRYGQSPIVAVIDGENAGKSLAKITSIPHNTPIVKNVLESLQYHPEVLLIGIAPSGGVLPPPWREEVRQAIEQGLSVVNGLHTPLAPQFPHLKSGQWIWDIRQEPPDLSIGKARAKNLSCERILTVGTDMGIGKMSTCLELHRAALGLGWRSKFLATGQGGIMIAGEGIPLDAISVDFAAVAVEKLVLAGAEKYDILFIEGQGSLLHPGSTATLPLMRGSQPTGLVLVHRVGQVHIRDLPDILIPPLVEVIKLYETVGKVATVGEGVKVKAIALNTYHLNDTEAEEAVMKVQGETGLPCTDVVRWGGAELLNSLIKPNPLLE